MGYQEIIKLLSGYGYEVEDMTILETSLSNGQKQLMLEKDKVARMNTELVEVEKCLTDTKEELAKKVRELMESKVKVTGDVDITDLNAKLKKTLSERDLLIREYKNVKDSNTKLEAEVKKLSLQIAQVNHS